MKSVLMHYERRSVVAKAVIWGIAVTLAGVSLDYLVGCCGGLGFSNVSSRTRLKGRYLLSWSGWYSVPATNVFIGILNWVSQPPYPQFPDGYRNGGGVCRRS
jgi:hypothetical protein